MLQQAKNYNPNIHHRRSIRLKGYDYSQAGMYFVTVCAHVGAGSARPDDNGRNDNGRAGSARPFGNVINGEMVLNEYGKIIANEWQQLNIKYPCVALHEYVVMPNHFHGIVEITANVGAGFARPDDDGRANTARSDDVNGRADPARSDDVNGRADPAPTLGNIMGYFKFQTTKKINLPVKLWQRGYYEIIIRNEKSYQYIANYIINNPAKWENDKFYNE